MYAPPPPESRSLFALTRYSVVTYVILISEQNYVYMLVLNIEVDAGDDVARNASYERKTAEFHMYFYNIKLQVNKAQALLNVDEWFLLKM